MRPTMQQVIQAVQNVRRALQQGQYVTIDIRPFRFTHVRMFAQDCARYGGAIQLTHAAGVPSYMRNQLARDAMGRMTFAP